MPESLSLSQKYPTNEFYIADQMRVHDIELTGIGIADLLIARHGNLRLLLKPVDNTYKVHIRYQV